MKELAHHEGPDYEPHDLPAEDETILMPPPDSDEEKQPHDQTTKVYKTMEALRQVRYPFVAGVRL